MNKRMVFIVILVITVLLYDLVFHTTCFFPEQCYPVCMVHLVASVLYSHVIMAAFAKAFSNYCNDALLSLYPIKLFEIKMEKCYGVRQELNRQIDSNLCVLQWALLLVLCSCLQHLKMSSNFSIQFLLFNLHFGFWDAYNPYLHKMGKKVQHLFEENCQVQPYIKFFVGDDFFSLLLSL